ncbi:hypothetical protein TSAR_002020 [Trichomalopsis sarcophagae]|uniref:Uncharacterized protein n=1 Tax=Trichomalopsis sarcophagae TaxID=543379 RepID=A0A232EDZ7_9HYME|nr:hypothetical protein TSAR_002020 [Trichomalopsis sarcophagae]
MDRATSSQQQQQRHYYHIRRKYLDILEVLCCYLDTTQRTALLRQACPKLVISLVECVLNILRGNVPLSRPYKNKLRKHAPLLRKIIAPGQTIQTRNSETCFNSIEHARKMILVLQECIESTPGSEVLRLNDAMNKILNASELDDRQKYSMYQHVLQRFLHYKKQSSEDDEVAAAAAPSKTVTIADECVGVGHSNDNYLNTVQTPGSEVLRLDDEMNKILNSSELDDRQKYSMYQQVLQRFLHYKKQSSEDDEVGNELCCRLSIKHHYRCILLLQMVMVR